ncbi:MAG: signal peptidase I [Coprococcus sp.]
MKKVLLTIVNIISILIIIAAVGVLIIVLMTKPGSAPNIGGYMALRVTTGSMAPTYGIDTLIIVKETEPSEIKEGDVISFYSSDPALDGAVNTHRVVSVEKEGDSYRYVTKGDANNVVDKYDVDSKFLLGKVIGSSLVLGKIVRLVSNPLIFIPVILIPLAILLISNLIHTVVYAKKIARDEEEAAVKEAIEMIRDKHNKEKG